MTSPASGHRWGVFKQLVFATYGDICWILPATTEALSKSIM